MVTIPLKNAYGLYVRVSPKDAKKVREWHPRLWFDGKKFAIVGDYHSRIARVITGVLFDSKKRVYLKDGNPFNLTRSNLEVRG